MPAHATSPSASPRAAIEHRGLCNPQAIWSDALMNGRLSERALAPIPGGRLRRDAAAAWNAMNAESERRFGVTLRPRGPKASYRTYAQQVLLRRYWCARGRCDNAAVPG